MSEYAEDVWSDAKNEFTKSFDLLGADASSTINIQAKSFFGARHALTTLQQLIWYDDEDDMLRMLSGASIADEPKFK